MPSTSNELRVGWLVTDAKEFRDFIAVKNDLVGKSSITFNLYHPEGLNLVSHESSGSSNVLPEFSFFVRKTSSLIALCMLRKNSWRTFSHSIREQKMLGSRAKKGQLNDSVIEYNWNTIGNFLRALVRIFSTKLGFSIAIFFNELSLRIDAKRFKHNFDQVHTFIIPYSALLDGKFDAYVRILRLQKRKTIAIQSNWDNLSSKSFVREFPDLFCVWGEQSKFHLVNFHGYPINQVKVLGSPRLGLDFWKLSHSSDKTNSGGRRVFKIFLAGTGDGLDDYELVSAVLETINESKLAKKTKLIYRPHPFSRSPSEIERVKSLLEASKIASKEILKSEDVFQNYRSYFGELASSNLMISHLSTLCLESLLLKTPICIPTFIGSKKAFNWQTALNSLEHYKGFQLAQGVTIATSLESLTKTVSDSQIKQNLQNTNLNWIVRCRPFSESLLELLND